jgi:hypothetical protein
MAARHSSADIGSSTQQISQTGLDGGDGRDDLTPTAAARRDGPKMPANSEDLG